MGIFLEYCRKVQEALDPETGQNMDGNHPAATSSEIPDGDGNMGYGDKKDPGAEFEHAAEAAQELLDALETLNPLIPDEDATIDINKVTKQVKGILHNLQALAGKLNGNSQPAIDQFDSGQTTQSIV